MPVSIKVSQIKYKDNNGNYVGINGVAEQSTAEEIAAIEAAGATAETAIETKGAQTIASIPSDYTELSDDVERLKDIIPLQALFKSGIVTIHPSLSGGYYNASGKWINDSRYLSNDLFLCFPDGLDIQIECTGDATSFISEHEMQNGVPVRVRSSGSYAQSSLLENTSSDKLYNLILRNTVDPVSESQGTFYILDSEYKQLIEDLPGVKEGVEVTSSFVNRGEYSVPGELVLGYYNSTGKWQENSNQHASVHKLYRFPSGLNLYSSNTFSAGNYIKEFQKNAAGSYSTVRNESSGYLNGTNEEYYYSFDFYKSSGYESVPEGYSIWAEAPYIQSLSGGADSKFSYSYTSSSLELTLTGTKTKYVIKRVIDNSINVDSWRLYAGYVMINGEWVKMWENSDAEGPIKLEGEEDFISGYHGDEILDEATLYLDNTELDVTANASGTAESFMLYQESTCYHVGTSNVAFTRYKKVSIKNNNFTVQQRWISQTSGTINRGALCLFQCYNTPIIGWDTDLLIPMQSHLSSASLDAKTRTGNLYLNGGIKISLTAEQGADNEYFSPSLNQFSSQNRVKWYFDMYNGMSISSGDELVSKFTVRVNDYTK